MLTIERTHNSHSGRKIGKEFGQFRTAVLSALLFAAGFVFWTHYPHGLPLPTSVTSQKAPDSLRPNERIVEVAHQPDNGLGCNVTLVSQRTH